MWGVFLAYSPTNTHTHTPVSHFPRPYLSGSGILAATTALCQAEERRPREQDADKKEERGVSEKSMGTRETQDTHTHTTVTLGGGTDFPSHPLSGSLVRTNCS